MPTDHQFRAGCNSSCSALNPHYETLDKSCPFYEKVAKQRWQNQNQNQNQAGPKTEGVQTILNQDKWPNLQGIQVKSCFLYRIGYFYLL